VTADEPGTTVVLSTTTRPVPTAVLKACTASRREASSGKEPVMVTVLPALVSVYGVLTGAAVVGADVVATALLLAATTLVVVCGAPIWDRDVGEVATSTRVSTSGTPTSARNHQPPGRRRYRATAFR
jgi:hypothetical protein